MQNKKQNKITRTFWLYIMFKNNWQLCKNIIHSKNKQTKWEKERNSKLYSSKLLIIIKKIEKHRQKHFFMFLCTNLHLHDPEFLFGQILYKIQRWNCKAHSQFVQLNILWNRLTLWISLFPARGILSTYVYFYSPLKEVGMEERMRCMLEKNHISMLSMR